ncbi:MAG: thiamine-monophosphate kinase [Phycisphaerales bacterium]|nr:MAG: thiamine-monophosphate kinase [Phycisphaerales bacterium]
MNGGELDFVRWLQRSQQKLRAWTKLAVGDDMAVLDIDGAAVLVTTDMLLDGVHFSTATHSLEAIGGKAVACSLSDCAAMAVRPLAAAVSVALNDRMGAADARRLVGAMRRAADAFDCDLVGGDTTRWSRPLAIDVCMIASPYPGIEPVRRGGARPGDALVVTGPLGGSLRGRHLTFTPRVREARRIAETLGPSLHALMDISDGLSLDVLRMCEASGTGALLEEEALDCVISEAAREAAAADGRSPLVHALHDGEDFELLAAVAPDAATPARLAELGLCRVGQVRDSDLRLVDRGGRVRALEPRGYDHFDG